MTELVPESEPAGISRRSMLTRTAAIGGVAWVTPAVLASPASAATTSRICGSVVKATKNMKEIPAPASAFEGDPALESDTVYHYWQEQDGFVLTSPLAVDQTPTGGATTIPAGTAIASYFVHFDPETETATIIVAAGSLTFDKPILGIAKTVGTLDASDYLGSPPTTYPAGAPRGSGEPGDVTVVGENAYTFSLESRRQGFDQVRVIVACDGD